jgi:aconitate hydratase A / 2-methylisocitrate dehydratase
VSSAAPDILQSGGRDVAFWKLERAADASTLERLPYIVRLFLENLLRHRGDEADCVETLAGWPGGEPIEFPFLPARVVLQDFTGVPVVADLAAMRSAVARFHGDAARVNPVVPVDLVIDHSVIVDVFGRPEAFDRNVRMEVERNRERYAFLRWAQGSFDNFSVVPPGAGIVHQVNLEYLAKVVIAREIDGTLTACPDTLVGTDSHTTMIGGVGVLGWGVGGIEAEAAMLGEPVSLLTPSIVGVRLKGRMASGATATDLVLTLTEMLRKHGVVGRFVEFFGSGLGALTVQDRATVSNMSPEYGATQGFFPVDAQTLVYLRGTGRDEELVGLVERYCKEQHLFREEGAPEPTYSEVLEFDLSTLEPSLAGPRRPQDRVSLPKVPRAFRNEFEMLCERLDIEPEIKRVSVDLDGERDEVGDGSIVIAAITSCTNTSNPSVMLGAGLLAKHAVERGLRVKPSVKTSLAPGSPVVMDYYERTGLLPYLEKLGFYLVGFGCTTCIGNSGPLPDAIAEAIDKETLACVAVLSGNRNFEGRIHPQVRMSFLASPPLVVAYALAGRSDIDLTSDPIGTGEDGKPVMLSEIWPTDEEIAAVIDEAMNPVFYRERYARIFEGNPAWTELEVPEGDLYAWDESSTYLAEPPFINVEREPAQLEDIHGARILVWVGDSVTTDHISPAGQISPDSPAAAWLMERGVDRARLHSYGARRGNHHVMVRGTFANIRLRNRLVDIEGGSTTHFPDRKTMTIFDASERYRDEGVPLIVVAGKEYGAGSSRDWAAKGTALLGVRAVIAESYERIHRANLVQMGVLPLQFGDGENADSLGLRGDETFDVTGIAGKLKPGMTVPVVAKRDDGSTVEFEAIARLDAPADVEYYRHGGILPAVLRKMIA